MIRFIVRLWRDEDGHAGVEWAFLASILVLGAVTGAIIARHMQEGP